MMSGIPGEWPRVVLFDEPVSGRDAFVRALDHVGACAQAFEEPAQVLGAVIERKPHAIIWVARSNPRDVRVLRAVRDVVPDSRLLLFARASDPSAPSLAREFGALDCGMVPTAARDLEDVLRRTLGGFRDHSGAVLRSDEGTRP